LPRIAALAGSEAAASARKLETLIVTRAYRFNRLSFRPSATPAMCPTDQRAEADLVRPDVGQPSPILSQPVKHGNEDTKKTINKPRRSDGVLRGGETRRPAGASRPNWPPVLSAAR
jgi:hypothetical protein